MVFESYETIFKDYVDFFSGLREKSGILNIFSKLIINSTYGRLGMRGDECFSFVDKKENMEKITKTFNVIRYKELNNVVIVEVSLDDKERALRKKLIKTNVVLAAAITSKARIKLFTAQEAVMGNGGRLLYSDTDSIFAAFNRDVSGEAHGEVLWGNAKQDTRIAKALFFSQKSYALLYENGLSVIKIRGYDERSLSFRDLETKFQNKERISVEGYNRLNKNRIKLLLDNDSKIFDLSIYDKRCFVNQYDTIPYTYDNYSYTRAD